MFKRYYIPSLIRSVNSPVSAAESMNSMSAELKTTGSKKIVPRYYAGGILIILIINALLISGGWYYLNRPIDESLPPVAVHSPANYITNDELEAKYGIRVTLIAVTAVGGIVDFRYKVVDPEKSALLLHDPANAPILTAVDSGLTLSPTKMSRHHSQMGIKRGAVPFTFYPNIRGAVKPGTPVSVAFGNINVEPITAQ